MKDDFEKPVERRNVMKDQDSLPDLQYLDQETVVYKRDKMGNLIRKTTLVFQQPVKDEGETFVPEGQYAFNFTPPE